MGVASAIAVVPACTWQHSWCYSDDRRRVRAGRRSAKDDDKRAQEQATDRPR